MERLSQCEKIIRYMEKNGEITQRDAFFMGIQRLASRIHDIKRSGDYKIKTEMRKVKNADESETYIAVYSLEGGDQNG